MTPEQQARETIDALLARAGWAVRSANTGDDVLATPAGRLAYMEHRLTHEEAIDAARMRRGEIR